MMEVHKISQHEIFVQHFYLNCFLKEHWYIDDDDDDDGDHKMAICYQLY